MKKRAEGTRAIVLFDGVCNYCNRWVNFLIRHDRKDRLRFAPLQSARGKELLKKYAVPDVSTETFVLIENGKFYLRSTAGLRVLRSLGGLYSLAGILLIVPRFLRDGVYRVIARNRYKWRGRRESCMVPGEEVRGKFL